MAVFTGAMWTMQIAGSDVVAWEVNFKLTGVNELTIEKEMCISPEMFHQLIPIMVFRGSGVSVSLNIVPLQSTRESNLRPNTSESFGF